MLHKLSFILILFISSSLSAQTNNTSLPLFEVGIASFYIHTVDYPGADQSRGTNITLPSFIYRGKIFRNDKYGLRARFFESAKIKTDLSFGASLPARSKDNKAREGMDDLDWVSEIGPRVTYAFFDNKGVDSLVLLIPLRFAFSTDLKHTEQRGLRFNPEIDYRLALNKSFRWSIGFELNYGTEDLNDYFYEVAQRDTTQNREAYNAKGGYLGNSISTNIIFRNNKFTGVLGAKYSRYDGAANENSPLVKVKDATSVFMAFNYFFYQSKEMGDDSVGLE